MYKTNLLLLLLTQGKRILIQTENIIILKTTPRNFLTKLSGSTVIDFLGILPLFKKGFLEFSLGINPIV